MKKTIALVIAFVLMMPAAGRAQGQPDIWRGFVEKTEVGTDLEVRLHDGTRFRAVLIGTQPDAVLLQPRTRVPVPVQPIAYDAIASLERRGSGVGAAKAAAIGVATGVGAFFAIMLIFVATAID